MVAIFYRSFGWWLQCHGRAIRGFAMTWKSELHELEPLTGSHAEQQIEANLMAAVSSFLTYVCAATFADHSRAVCRYVSEY